MGKSSRARGQAQAQTDAANIQANAALQIAANQQAASITQSQTALEAARVSSRGSIQAAGIVAGASALSSGRMARASRESLALQREQYDASVERLQPYQDLGDQFLGTVADAATPEGYAQRLSDIMNTDIFGDLQSNRMRAASSMLGQAGLGRSGAAARAASDITANVAIGLDDRIYGRQMNNVNVGGSAAAMQSNIGQNYASTASNTLTSTAANQGIVTMQGAGQQAGFISQGANQMAQGLNAASYYSGQGVQQMGAGIMGAANAQAGGLIGSSNAIAQGGQNRDNLYGTLAGAAGTVLGGYFMSDERLKKNMGIIGKIKDLTLWEWDWHEFAKNMMGCEMMTGFKAQEVEIKYPNCVHESHGIKVIDYGKLYNILEAA